MHAWLYNIQSLTDVGDVVGWQHSIQGITDISNESLMHPWPQGRMSDMSDLPQRATPVS
jgi:hypothetical protein